MIIYPFLVLYNLLRLLFPSNTNKIRINCSNGSTNSMAQYRGNNAIALELYHRHCMAPYQANGIDLMINLSLL